MRFSHGFNQWQVGLTFLGIFVGMVRLKFVEIVTLSNVPIRLSEFSAIQYRKEHVRTRNELVLTACSILMEPADTKLVQKNNGISEPEFRLPSTIVYVLLAYRPFSQRSFRVQGVQQLLVKKTDWCHAVEL